jgi:hypothetical protein
MSEAPPDVETVKEEPEIRREFISSSKGRE